MYCTEKNYDSKTNRQMAVAFLTKTSIGLRRVKIVFFCFCSKGSIMLLEQHRKYSQQFETAKQLISIGN